MYPFIQWTHLHSFIPICIEEIHLIASLDPANGPDLFAKHGWHLHLSWCPEVRRVVSQNHIRWLIDDSRTGINGGLQFQDCDVLMKTWLEFYTLYTSHGGASLDWQHKHPSVFRWSSNIHDERKRVQVCGHNAMTWFLACQHNESFQMSCNLLIQH